MRFSGSIPATERTARRFRQAAVSVVAVSAAAAAIATGCVRNELADGATGGEASTEICFSLTPVKTGTKATTGLSQYR